MRFDIIKNLKFWLTFGLIAMAMGVGLFLSNLRLSIQFVGGMEVIINTQVDENKLKSDLQESFSSNELSSEVKDILSKSHITVGKKDGFTDILFKMNIEKDENVKEVQELILKTLTDKEYISGEKDIEEQTVIGPSVGEYMKSSAIVAIISGLVLMSIYILFAFSGMRNVISPLTLALITTFTMFFDIAIPAGAYGLLMAINQTVQIDSIFIIAVLTIMGYSINDTIVIFDRIRENLSINDAKIKKGEITYEEVFENSLWQTMRRSIGTSVSTFLVVLAMYIFGTGVLKMFAFALGIGVIAGTYSSIFLAAPLAYLLSGKYKNEHK